MRNFRISLLLALLMPLSVSLAEDLDSGLAKLSDNLATAVGKSGTKKISVIDFTDLQGHTSELGRFIAEQLSVSLVNSSKDFSVMDRANMKNILDEHKLTASGLVNPTNARDLGRFSGVDAIVLGSITQFGETLSITAKAISTETTQVLAASKVTIDRSKNLDSMLAPEAAAPPSGTQSPTASTGKDFVAPNGTSAFENIEIEIVSFKPNNQGAILVLVKVQNRNKNNPLRIGLNSNNSGQAGTFLVDEQGNTYPLSGIGGLSFSRSFYGGDRNTFESKKRMAVEAQQNANYRKNLFEDLDKDTEVAVGQSVTFTLQFASTARSPGTVFRFNCEMTVSEIQRNDWVKVALNNIVIPGIQPK